MAYARGNARSIISASFQPHLALPKDLGGLVAEWPVKTLLVFCISAGLVLSRCHGISRAIDLLAVTESDLPLIAFPHSAKLIRLPKLRRIMLDTSKADSSVAGALILALGITIPAGSTLPQTKRSQLAQARSRIHGPWKSSLAALPLRYYDNSPMT